mmetsp:Transcript_109490/g.315302  ORF Transcript_109490/g.315302 Transcript_109490/m.315302 type:complete len:490 (+) Transcript_109490:756-2225(+)
MVLAVQAELAATEGEHDRVRRRRAGEVREVAPRSLGAIATANDKDMLQLPCFDGPDHLIGDAEDGVAAKAGLQRGQAGLSAKGGVVAAGVEDRERQGLVDERRVVVVGDMPDVVEAHRPARPDAVVVLPRRGAQAVGGHEDRAREVAELEELVAPMRSEVPDEVVVFTEFGVAVSGQHLAMRVHVDAAALRLLQQRLQNPKVVPAHEDRGAPAAGFRRDVGGPRAAELGHVGCVQHLHDLQVQAAQGQALGEGAVQGLPRVSRRAAPGFGQVAADAEHLVVDLVAVGVGVGGVAGGQVLRVGEVGGCALHAVGRHLDDAEEVLVADASAPGDEARGRGGAEEGGAVPGQARRQARRRLRRRGVRGLQCRDQLRRLLQGGLEARVVEVDVRERREGRGEEEVPHLGLARAAGPRRVRELREAQVVEHLQVLQAGKLRRLRAHTDRCAAGARGRLLALVAKHLWGALRRQRGRAGVHGEAQRGSGHGRGPS